MKSYNALLTNNKIFSNFLIYTGVIAAGIIIPYLTHLAGGQQSGMILLPLHFVILTTGLLFGWEMGITAGITLPVISFLISGMPPLPILPQMTVEIGIYGAIAGFLYKNLKKNIYLSLFAALISGRVFLIVFYLLSKHSLSFFMTQLKLGSVGILLQIILIPFIIQMFSSNKIK